jgi:hypothetical protein
MKGWYDQLYITLLLISNTVAVLQLIAAIKKPGVARISFFLLFAWASWINWKTSQQSPQDYLAYADLTWSGWYRAFICGWFAGNIKLAVGVIAACQGMIAISMLMKGWVFRVGAIGAMIFLVAILPLGIGSGFPCTAIMVAAIYILLKKADDRFIWDHHIATVIAKGIK